MIPEMNLVRGSAEEALALDDDDQSLLHHWTSAKWRIVCVDLAFALTQSALQLYEKGFRFIGVIKQAMSNYPKKYLGEVMVIILFQHALTLLVLLLFIVFVCARFSWLRRERSQPRSC